MNTEQERGTPTVDPTSFSPWNNYGASPTACRLIASHAPATSHDVDWVMASLVQAERFAEDGDRVVVVGVAEGDIPHGCFTPASLDVTGFGFRGGPIEPGPDTVDEYIVDLSMQSEIAAMVRRFDDKTSTLYVLPDVLGRLRDPRSLLRSLRRALKRHPHHRLLLTNPSPVASPPGGHHSPIASRFRMWSDPQFAAALRGAGFTIHVSRRLEDTTGQAGTLFLVGCDSDSYGRYLEDHGLPPKSDHLILTTEWGGLGRSGGIGSYCMEASAALPTRPLILIAGAAGLDDSEVVAAAEEHGLLHVERFGATRQDGLDRDAILSAVQQILFIYDDVTVIEYQDYQGVGARVAQAKRAHLLPADVRVACYAHGNHFYLDVASGGYDARRDPEVDAWERISLQEADSVFFPSEYLRDLYLDRYCLQIPDARLVRLPFSLSAPPNIEFEDVDTIIFLGKDTPQKGYPEFLAALRALLADPATRTRIRHVMLIGIPEPPRWLSGHSTVNVLSGSVSRAEVRRRLASNASRSVVVLPFKGDNQPLTVWEVIDAGGRFVAFEAGGVPEQLPTQLRNRLLCPPTADDLARHLRAIISGECREHELLFGEVRLRTHASLLRATEAYAAAIQEMKVAPPATTAPRSRSGVTVLMTNFNGESEWLEDAFRAINQSFERPADVVIVDDGSYHRRRELLLASVAAHLDPQIPSRIVSPERNVGLAGARNFGMRFVSTPYVMIHDNDDLIRNDFLGLARTVLDSDPRVGAVAPWLEYFLDGENWATETVGLEVPAAFAAGREAPIADYDLYGYRPMGQDLGIGLTMNCLGPACSVFRVGALRDIGYWDSTSRAKWEDWECLINLTVEGWRIQILPVSSVMYRVRRDSMLRTYPDFDGFERLWRSLPVPPSQQVGLLREMLFPRGLRQELELRDQDLGRRDTELQRLNAEIEKRDRELELVQRSRVWRTAERLRSLRKPAAGRHNPSQR